ncbi:type II toxin-antitoxin system RelE/ParE family toxin [Roseomonas sp. E05]|uniref:type II toxin-antitoxin system RelE family toxin n=1 Tax=Roseomonas sp. E05 TaxID=3046310 RepID=UPI0024B8D731|nr:type II toxin-antitoxin system RelE/ParE family toxin [Roseomonas sp. E05]MDJ0390266.1 type II toxin-antitoxin system RelE/ParE family toxin [Roseomonas sp. E05]
MLPVTLILPRSAVKEFLAVPKREREQLKARLEAIAADPEALHPNVQAMRGEPPGRFRVRQGDWRAIFTVIEGDVFVIRIAHRREVYD